jgi:[protein-PII] uridylyltransferase
VAEAIGSPLVLELLHALTEADSLATGPSAWSAWKAELVGELVTRVGHVLGGGELGELASWRLFPTPEVLALMGAGRSSLKAAGDILTVVASDRPGLFARVAGVLALHGMDVLGAHAYSDDHGMAASEFRVAPPAEGREHHWNRVLADLERALEGRLALEARLAERVRTYQRRRRAGRAGPITTRVVIDNAASSNATVVEVHAPDALGVLYRITRALAEMLCDIRLAKVQTLGPEVVDAFYVCDHRGCKIEDPAHLRELERAVLHGLAEG